MMGCFVAPAQSLEGRVLPPISFPTRVGQGGGGGGRGVVTLTIANTPGANGTHSETFSLNVLGNRLARAWTSANDGGGTVSSSTAATSAKGRYL